MSQALLARLADVRAPDAAGTLAERQLVLSAELSQGVATIALRLPTPSFAKADVEREVEAAARSVAGVTGVELRWRFTPSRRTVGEEDPVPQVKNIVLVMSGKGGVGKSTVSCNLALGLAALGCSVGLLDADIYGPSIPTMFGVSGRPMSDGSKIQPLSRFGIKLMSIGFLLDDPKSAVVWRGPMLHGALMQFLGDVAWGDLDYMLLDLPPGTGDIALTLSQKVQSTGAVVVTTPQEVALQDVYKAVSMNQKVGIPILGVVENQSYFVCDSCQTRHELFGSGGGQKVAEMAGAPLLGQIPLHKSVREWGDAGTPVVQAAPGSPTARAFDDVAIRLAEQIELENQARGAPLTIDRSGGVNRHLPVAR
jgi:ATP-binding protein involved in chromosome partitioning